MERLKEVAEIHREEKPEELETRLIFVWFFVAVVILLVLIGSFLIINSIAEDLHRSKVLRQSYDEGQLMQIASGFRSLFGIVLACMGLIVCMLTVFETYWEDRYFIVGIGILMIILGILIFLWIVRAPGIGAGLMILGMALICALYVGIINTFGWLRLKKHKFSVFFSVVLICLLFCLSMGLYMYHNPRIFLGA